MAILSWREIAPPSTGATADLTRTAGDLLNKGFGAGIQALDDYGKWQDKAESGKVMAWATQQQDPEALKAALANGTALSGIDPSRVSPEAFRYLNDQQKTLLDTTGKGLQNDQTRTLTRGYQQANELRDLTRDADAARPYLLNDQTKASTAQTQASTAHQLIANEVATATKEADIRRPFLQNEKGQFDLDKARDDKKTTDDQLAAQGVLNSRLAEIQDLRRQGRNAEADDLLGSQDTAKKYDDAGYKPEDYQKALNGTAAATLNVGASPAQAYANREAATDRATADNVKGWLGSLMSGDNMAPTPEAAIQVVANDPGLSPQEKQALTKAIVANKDSWPTKSDGLVTIPGEQRKSLTDLVPRVSTTTTTPMVPVTGGGTPAASPPAASSPAVAALAAAAPGRPMPNDPQFNAATAALSPNAPAQGGIGVSPGSVSAPPTPAVVAASRGARTNPAQDIAAAAQARPSAGDTGRGPTQAAAGGYDVVLGNGRYGTPSKPVSTMTIAEANQFGKDVLIPNSKAAGVGKSGDKVLGSSAMGKYQFIGSTMVSAAQQLGLDPNTTVLTPEIQDRLAIQVAKTQGLGAWEGLTKDPAAMAKARSQLASGDYPGMLATISSVESGGKGRNDVAIAQAPVTAAGSIAAAASAAPNDDQARLEAARLAGPASYEFMLEQIAKKNGSPTPGLAPSPPQEPTVAETADQILKRAQDGGENLSSIIGKMATAGKVDSAFSGNQDLVNMIANRENGKSPSKEKVIADILAANKDLTAGDAQGAVNQIMNKYGVSADVAGFLYTSRGLDQKGFGWNNTDKDLAWYNPRNYIRNNSDQRGFNMDGVDKVFQDSSGRRYSGQELENRLVSAVSQSGSQSQAADITKALQKQADDVRQNYMTLKAVAERTGNQALLARAEAIKRSAEGQIALKAAALAQSGKIDPNSKTLR